MPTAPAESSESTEPPHDSNEDAILMQLWRAEVDFAADDYGADYVDLTREDPVELIEPPAPLQVDHQWNYGKVGNRTGWFPSEFVQRALYTVLADFAGSDWGSEYLCLAASSFHRLQYGMWQMCGSTGRSLRLVFLLEDRTGSASDSTARARDRGTGC